jgi:hypothetical protein
VWRAYTELCAAFVEYSGDMLVFSVVASPQTDNLLTVSVFSCLQMLSMDTSYSKDVQWSTLQLQHLAHNTGTDAQEVPQVSEADAAEWSSQADFENREEGEPPQGKEWSTRSHHAAFEAVFTFSESSNGAGDA